MQNKYISVRPTDSWSASFNYVAFLCLTIAIILVPGHIIAETIQTGEAIQPEDIGESFVISSSKIHTLMVVMTLVSVLVAGASSFVAYKFYYWRRTIDTTGSLTPESWGEYLKSVGNVIQVSSKDVGVAVHDNISTMQKVHKAALENTSQISKETNEIKEMLLTFQSSLDEKDREISRLREGYDFQILKNMLIQLATLHSQFLELGWKNPDNKLMFNCEILIRDLMENAGVEIGAPKKGELFSDYPDLVEVVGHTSSNGAGTEKGQISTAHSNYYIFEGPASRAVLKKAKITYYLPEDS